MTTASEILAELHARGVRIEPRPHGGVRLVPARLIDAHLLERICANKSAVLAHIHAEQEAAEGDRVARADERKPQPPAGHPAYSILETSHRYGVALRIDSENGDLVVGKVGAKANEPTQPWVDLVRELEAYVETVAQLVEVGWTLRTEFPKDAET